MLVFASLIIEIVFGHLFTLAFLTKGDYVLIIIALYNFPDEIENKTVM